MKERRSLVEGLKPDPDLQKIEEVFVFGAKRIPGSENEGSQSSDQAVSKPIEIPQPLPHSEQRILPQMTGRIPVTTRCRPEVASALKRASLQRQLAGAEPYYVQDIMEEALELWLHGKGYITTE